MSSDDGSDSNGWNRARGLAVKTLLLIGGALLVKRLRKSTTRWDHARFVSNSLTGEKVHSQFFSLSFILINFFEINVLGVVFKGASFQRPRKLFQH